MNNKKLAVPRNSGRSLRKIALLVLRTAIGIALLIWLEKSGALNFHAFARLWRTGPLTLGAVAILLLDFFLMSIRVWLLFRAQNLSLSLEDAFHLTMTGFLFSMFLLGTAGGEVARFYYAARQNQGKHAEIAAALLLDRLIGLLSMILLPLLFAPFLLNLIRSLSTLRRILCLDALLALCLLLGLFVAIFFEPFRYRFWPWLKKLPALQGLWERATGTVAAYRGHRAVLLSAMILSLLANCAYIVVTGLGFYAISPASFSPRVLLVAPVGHLINALPLTPGGLGVGEAAFNALFTAAGMHGGADALFCVRLWNAIVALAYAAIFVWGLGWRHRDTTVPGRETGERAMIEAAQPQFDKG